MLINNSNLKYSFGIGIFLLGASLIIGGMALDHHWQLIVAGAGVEVILAISLGHIYGEKDRSRQNPSPRLKYHVDFPSRLSTRFYIVGNNDSSTISNDGKIHKNRHVAIGGGPQDTEL